MAWGNQELSLARKQEKDSLFPPSPMSLLSALSLLVVLVALCSSAQGVHTNAVAHRGASADVAENTLAAFIEAERQGAEWVELDTRVTKDGVVILMHDSTLVRTTNCTGFVSSNNYYGDIQYCIAEETERVPTFIEFLHYLRNSTVKAVVDIKGGEDTIAAMGKDLAVFPFDITQQLLLAGQSEKEVELCKKYAPNHLRSYTVRSLPDHPTDLDLVSYNADFSILTRNPEFITEAHAAGITVFAWTLDKESDWQEAIDLDVDGVVTNLPGDFVAFRDSQ